VQVYRTCTYSRRRTTRSRQGQGHLRHANASRCQKATSTSGNGDVPVQVRSASCGYDRSTTSTTTQGCNLDLDVTPDIVRRDLQIRQQRQKFYHDQRTRPLSSLQPGDAVRVHNGQSWQAAKVVAAHPSPRSYNIETDNGIHLRRNRRDLIRTREDPPVCNRQIDDDPPTVAPSRIQHDSGPTSCIKTSLGRTVKPPVRFRDYVMNS